MRTVAAAALLASLALALSAGVASAAPPYKNTLVDVQARMQQDGSVLVIERRVYQLAENFEFVAWDIPKHGAPAIEVLGFTGPRGEHALAYPPAQGSTPRRETYAVEDFGDRLIVYGYFQPTKGEVEFTVRYLVPDGARYWNGGGQLYELLSRQQEPGTVRQVRVIFSEVDDAIAPMVPPPAASILPPEAIERVSGVASVAIAVLVPLAIAVIAVAGFIRRSRVFEPAPNPGPVTDAPSDLAPAALGALFGIESPGSVEVVSTIAHLIDRGVVTAESDPDSGETRLSRAPAHETVVTPFERSVVRVLFSRVARSDSFTPAELGSAFARPASMRSYRIAHWRWRRLLERQLIERGLVERPSRTRRALSVFFGAVCALAGALPLLTGGSWLLAVWGAAAGAMTVTLAFALRRLTQDGADLRTRYAALREYLHAMNDGVSEWPDDAGWWRHMLVLSEEFGIADEVRDALAVRAPRVLDDPLVRLWDEEGAIASLREATGGRVAPRRFRLAALLPIRFGEASVPEEDSS